jgi:hypothetical protein
LKAQVSLTPTESKKLIAKAVVQMPEFRKALKNGIIVIHPSTTTTFIYEEVFKEKPKGVIVSGVVLQKGTCISMQSMKHIIKHGYFRKGPGEFRLWVIINGELQKDLKLGDVLGRMGPNDVYVKAANTLDPKKHAAVLAGAPLAGSIGLASRRQKEKGFKFIIPTGIEKLIPNTVEEATAAAPLLTREVGTKAFDYSMGMPCGLLPLNGIVVNELDAVRILSGATATPIGSGGVAGGEGSLTMVIEGGEREVNKAIEAVKEAKGAKLPKIVSSSCLTCIWPNCPWKGRDIAKPI